jgi:hypothetical protein
MNASGWYNVLCYGCELQAYYFYEIDYKWLGRVSSPCPQLNLLKDFLTCEICPKACTIEHYGLIIYGKWTDFMVS